MKKILLGALLVVGITSFAASAEWYDGGTLHQSTMAEWGKGSEANKLATCGDWVSGFYSNKRLNANLMALIEVKKMNGIKEISEGCVQMLDAANGPETATQKSAELFILGSMMGGWIEL